MKRKQKKAPLTANNLTSHIINEIELSGNLANRINNTGLYDSSLGIRRKLPEKERGKSDILACIRGHYVAIEIKIGKDRFSDDQLAFKARVLKSGGMYFHAKNGMDWEAIKKILHI